MSDDILQITEETKEVLRDFDEQEAYFLLLQIFSYAQATKDYAKFQSDLTEWKKRYPVDLFSDKFKLKIKYMLSNEFLDKVLKDFVAFDELSKKDPSKGLEKLRKILAKAEKHKDEKQLDKDLDKLYEEYPLKFLKEKYPHLVSQLLSKSNRIRILEKFDSSLAFKELENITKNPQDFKDVDEFKSSIEEWQKLYPTADFNDKYKAQVEQTLSNVLDDKNLNALFPISNELDLSEGQVIPIELQSNIQNISMISKDALYDFFKIVDKNKSDINSLFDWTCKYSRYINTFDSNTKNAIVNSLMLEYSHELPPISTRYEIPKMDTAKNDLLSLSDFECIDNTKKNVVLQLLGILSTGNELTHEDIYRLQIINSNVKKADLIKEACIEQKVDAFVKVFPEDKLTPYDPVYLSPLLSTLENDDISNTRLQTPETIDNVSATETEIISTDDVEIKNDITDTFKKSLQVHEPQLEKVDSTSSDSTSSDGSSSSGGTSISISQNEISSEQESIKNDEISENKENDTEPERISHHNPFQNFFKHFKKRDLEEEKQIDDDYER